MSVVAEFARELHESAHIKDGPVHKTMAVQVAGAGDSLNEIRAVIFDVYGTLIQYWKADFAQQGAREGVMLGAFLKVIDYFGLGKTLSAMNPVNDPEKTLFDFYHGLIALDHDKSRAKGVEFPEVRIEQLWGLILMMLKRNGYEPQNTGLGSDSDVAKCMGYLYHFHALDRGLYPGVARALKGLMDKNMRLGIVSNSQFYTPLDLTLFLRDQTNGAVEDYNELFDHELVHFSYETGRAKPDPLMFRRLYDALYEYSILPSETLFVGNDLRADIAVAADAGMKTALFCGDARSTFLHDLVGTVVPDLTFTSYADLPSLVAFHARTRDS